MISFCGGQSMTRVCVTREPLPTGLDRGEAFQLGALQLGQESVAQCDGEKPSYSQEV